MNDKIRIIVNVSDKGVREELEVPALMTAGELMIALDTIYGLCMDRENIFQYYLKADHPKALLRGNKTLQDYGVRMGTEIYVPEGDYGKKI